MIRDKITHQAAHDCQSKAHAIFTAIESIRTNLDKKEYCRELLDLIVKDKKTFFSNWKIIKSSLKNNGKSN